MSDTQTVLVTGARGFIGRRLCSALLAEGFQVIGVVRTSEGAALPGCQIEVLDLEEPFDADELISGVDAIVHLAGKAHGRGGPDQQTREAFDKSNVEPTRRLAEAAARYGRHFVYLSSIGVNGDETADSALTEASPVKPHAEYAESKLKAETTLRRAMEGGQATYSIIRPPLVYGEQAPGNFGRLIGLCGRPIPLPFGLARNRRTLVSVDSLVRLIILCLVRPEARNELFLAADEAPVSTREIIENLRLGAGKKPLMLPMPPVVFWLLLTLARKMSLYRQLFGNLEVDASKAASMLGWQRETRTLARLRSIGKEAAC